MTETLRRIVHPWECDAVEHFTTGSCFFRAYGASQWHLLQLLGMSEHEMAALRPRSCHTGFSRELRAGDPYHIESGVLEQDSGGLDVAQLGVHFDRVGRVPATMPDPIRQPGREAFSGGPTHAPEPPAV